jgi:hypothetical protein
MEGTPIQDLATEGTRIKHGCGSQKSLPSTYLLFKRVILIYFHLAFIRVSSLFHPWLNSEGVYLSASGPLDYPSGKRPLSSNLRGERRLTANWTGVSITSGYFYAAPSDLRTGRRTRTAT